MVGIGTIRGRSRRFLHDSTRTYPLPVNIVGPRLDNYAPKVGDVVSVFYEGEWAATPAVTSYQYQLQKDRVDSGSLGSTPSYTTLTADIGKRIRWGVFAFNTVGRSVQIAYTAETELVFGALQPPVNITPPSITGLSPPVQDETQLTSGTGEWSGFPTTFVGKWQRGTTDISGATQINYTPVAADVGLTLRVGVLASNAAGAAVSGYVFSQPTEIVEASAPVGTRVAGLSYTPDYVPIFTRPATFAAAETFAAAHPDLYPVALLDVNGFASFEAGLDAANTQDKSLAIGVDSGVGAYTISATKRYLKRPLIGFGSANPSVTFARTSANWDRSPHLFGHTQNIGCLFVKWVNCDKILCTTQPTLALVRNGVLNEDPSLGPSQLPYVNSGASKNAVNFRMLRCGKLTPSGSGNITALYMRRQIAGSPWTITTYSVDAFEQYLENIDLIGGATITAVTPTKIRDAINLHTGTHLVTALLSDDGLSVLLTKADRGYPLELIATCTGSLTCGTDPAAPWDQDENNNTWGIDIFFGYNELVDCNIGLCHKQDVARVGQRWIYKNDCPGTWSLMAGMGCLFTRLWAANNHHRDCVLSRPAAAGRTSSRQPQGSQFTCDNTFLGSICGGGMLATRYASTVLIIENNEALDVESNQTQADINCTVFHHIINGNDRVSIGGVVGGNSRIAWNKAKHYGRPDGGDDDGNWGYGSTVGLITSHNVFDAVGEGWASANLSGAEAAMTFKEGGIISNKISGLKAQRCINAPKGIPLCKFDGKPAHEHEQIYVENFDCTKGGVPYVNQFNSGALCYLGIINNFSLRQVFFKNCNFYPEASGGSGDGTGHCMTFGRVVATNMDFANFELNNIYCQNDGSPEWPEYTGDVPMFYFRFQNFPTGHTVSTVAAAFNAAVKIRDCYVLNAAGTIVGNITGVLWPDGIVNRTFAPNGRGDPLPRLTSVDTDGIPHFGAVW